MLKMWILVIIAVVPFIAPHSIFTDEYDDDPYRLNNGQHDFSISMLKNLEKNYPNKSHVFSPHSTYRVLLHTYLGLELSELTVESLKRGMHLEWANSENDVVEAYKAELHERSDRVLGKGFEFMSADKIYTAHNAVLKPRALELFSKLIEKVDFSDSETRRQEINAWVEEKTQNNIKDLIPRGAINPGTVFVLANAAFFKGSWETKFNKKNTHKATFNGAKSADVEMMSVEDRFNYGILEKENAAYLEMPYKTDDNSVSMFVYLPLENTPTAVDDLLSKISSRTIEQALSEARLRIVDVKFPKINLNGEYEFKKTFEDMGFKGLPFDRVIHKAIIEIDEEGTKASAATAAISRGGISFGDAPEFHCDHPFIFMINDLVSQEVLFAGVYRGPGN